MTIEARSGSHAIKCDCPKCHMELIRRTREQVLEEASLLGWRLDLDNDHALCIDCQQGRCPGDAVAESRFGAAAAIVTAPGPARKGAKVALPDGRVIGTVGEDVERRGDPMVLELAREPDRAKTFGAATAEKAPDAGLVIDEVVVLERPDAASRGSKGHAPS